MEDKKGALWGIYFVFITIFFCLMVVGFYYVQEDNTDSSLVSPRAVLKIQDNLELYEMEESKFIKESLQEVDAKFGTDEFIGEFREIFLGKISSDSDIIGAFGAGMLYKTYVAVGIDAGLAKRPKR